MPTEEEFYRHKDYWEQVADNQAHFFAAMHLTTLDIVILIPLVPLIPLALIWMAPWERWVWNNVPRPIIGPYVLYFAFALWHFHAPLWLVLLYVVIGAGLCVRALKDPAP